jgi:hypothetical protein
MHGTELPNAATLCLVPHCRYYRECAFVLAPHRPYLKGELIPITFAFSILKIPMPELHVPGRI